MYIYIAQLIEIYFRSKVDTAYRIMVGGLSDLKLTISLDTLSRATLDFLKKAINATNLS